MLDLGAWASEKYVVSDSVFDEEELTRADDALKTQNETIH